MSTPNFAELFLAHAGNTSSKWVQYLEVYDRCFAPYRNKPCRVLEIGVQNGGSLQLHQKYFPFAEKIVGVDIDPTCDRVEGGNIIVEIGSQADQDFLIDVSDMHGPFDIVVDDGSHIFTHQIASFETLFPRMSSAGVYIVEDIHTSYLPDFGGGVRKPDTFIEYAKLVLDQVNAPFFPDASSKIAWLADHLYSVMFYDSMVAFEKRAKATPFMLSIGSDGHKPLRTFQDLVFFRKRRGLP